MSVYIHRRSEETDRKEKIHSSIQQEEGGVGTERPRRQDRCCKQENIQNSGSEESEKVTGS